MAFALLAVVLVGAVVANEHRKSRELARSQSAIDLATATGVFDPTDMVGEYYGRQVASAEVTAPTIDPQVLGVTDGEKRIEVDLTNQRLYAFEGDRKIYDFLISSGKWGRTPTGEFRIWGKFRYTKMSGGSKEKRTYYYLPNVPYTMFFSNDQVPASRGFGIHGTYWHSNFGHPMSHGCINMKTEEAGLIYEWSTPSIGEAKSGRATAENPGTKVVIYGVAPSE